MDEKISWRKKMSLEILKYKLNKHKEKLEELFTRYNSIGTIILS